MAQDDQTVVQSEDEKQRRRQLSSQNPVPSIEGYELQRPLGQGSFGQVWGAIQLRTGQKVAIKILHESGSSSWSYFRHEIERLREVAEHPGIVTLIDADLKARPAYFVMPWLRHGSLAGLEQRASVGQVVNWFAEMANALQFTHEKGLLHCDLKPSNVLIDQEGRVRLTDFGQARLHGERGAFGTFGYMPPEQACEGGDHSPSVRWDTYALGATVYSLLTGCCPRIRDEDLTSLRSQSGTSEQLGCYRAALHKLPLVPVSTLNSAVDKELSALVESCLALDPARRPTSAGQILEDLERRRRGEPLLCRRPWSLAYRLERVLRRPVVQVALLMSLLLVAVLISAYQRLELQRQETERKNYALQLQLCDMQTERGTSSAPSDPQQAVLWWDAALRDLPTQGAGVEGRRRNLWLRIRYHLFHPMLWRRQQSERSVSCLSPDGQLVLTAIPGQNPELVDANTGQTLLTVKEPLAKLTDSQGLLFSPDSQRFAVLSEGHVSLYHRNGVRQSVTLLRSRLLAMQFSPGGELQPLVDDGMRGDSTQGGFSGDWSWVLSTSHLLWIYRGGVVRGPAHPCTCPPHGAAGKVALAHGPRAQVLDLTTGRALGPALTHPDAVLSVQLSPDGKMLATTCADRTLRLWDLPAGTQRVARPYTTDCLALAFRPDGKALAQSCADGKTRFWETRGGTLFELWRNQTGASAILFSPKQDKVLLLGPRGGMWMRQVLSPPMRQLTCRGPVRCLAYQPNGLLLMGGKGGLESWDGQRRSDFPVRSPVDGLRLSADGKRLWVHGQPDTVWQGGRQVRQADSPWQSVDFSADGKFMLAAGRSLEQVQLITGATQTMAGLQSPALWCRYHPSQEVLAGAGNHLGQGFVALFSSTTGRLIKKLQLKGEPLVSFEFDPSGAGLAAAGQGGGVYHWELQPPYREVEFRLTQAITTLAYCPATQRLAVASQDGTARVFQSRSLTPQFNELAHSRRLPIRCLAFSPDGKWLATGCDDGTARLWDSETGLLISSWLNHDGPVTALSFAPDGRSLASACEDGQVRLWDLNPSGDLGDLTKATGLQLDPKTGNLKVIP